MSNSKLNIMEYEDSQLANKYTSVTTADWFTLKGANYSIDFICDTADPNATTNYDEAPIGSEYTRISAGNVKKYIKTTATAWVVIGAQV